MRWLTPSTPTGNPTPPHALLCSAPSLSLSALALTTRRVQLFYDFKVQMGHSLSPSRTLSHTHTLTVSPACNSVWGQIYVLAIRHLLMVKNEL